jgi:beta-lactamase class A
MHNRIQRRENLERPMLSSNRRTLLRSILGGAVALVTVDSAGATPVEARNSISLPTLPATQTGYQLGWMLDRINEGAIGLSKSDLEVRFTREFLAALPANDLLAIVRSSFVPNGPMTVARFEGSASGTRIKAVLTTPGPDWRVTIGTEFSGSGRINQLYFEPVYQPAPLAKRVATWSSLKPKLAKIAPLVSFLAAEIVDGKLETVYSFTPNRTLGIGSSFKLYVLGELAQQIEAGSASWDEPLAIRDDLRSLPNGDMRLEPAGASYPILHYVEQMISASDNTATDHLITRLGRENVEAAFAEFGNQQPERNVPLLLTREWFAIKLRLKPAEIDNYLAVDTVAKRSLLANRVANEALTLTEEEEWPGAYYIEQIEWFASAADLCRVMTVLHNKSGNPGLSPIHDALSINPGIAFDARTWAYVGYKGGYETGVKSDVWLLQRRDDRWFVMAAIINDLKKEINGNSLWQHMMPAVKLLAGMD